MFSNKLAFIFFAILLFLTSASAQALSDPTYYYGYPTLCIRQPYTPVDMSGQNLPIVIDNTTGSGVNNSSYCVGSGWVYFQFFITLPTTSDTHQVRLSLPFVTSVLYDQPVTVGAFICPAINKAIYADVTPATVVKFFLTGDASAATYAELSGCSVVAGGVYYLH